MYKNTKSMKTRPLGAVLLLATSRLLSTRAPARYSVTALALPFKSGNGSFHRRLHRAMCFANRLRGGDSVVTGIPPARETPTRSVKICHMGDASGINATSTVEVPLGMSVETFLSHSVWSKSIFDLVLPSVGGPDRGWDIDLFVAGGEDPLDENAILSDYTQAQEDSKDGEPPALFALPRGAFVQPSSSVEETLLGKHFGKDRFHGHNKAITISLNFPSDKLSKAVSPGPVKEVQFQFRIAEGESRDFGTYATETEYSIAVRVGPMPDFSPVAGETEAAAMLRRDEFWKRTANDIHRSDPQAQQFQTILVKSDFNATKGSPIWSQFLNAHQIYTWADLVQLTNKPKEDARQAGDLLPLDWAVWRQPDWSNAPGSNANAGPARPGDWARWQEDNRRVAGAADTDDEGADSDSSCEERPFPPTYKMYPNLADGHLHSPELAVNWDGATARVLRTQDL